jgi:transcriptional regulator with XRE-family HTH domain
MFSELLEKYRNKLHLNKRQMADKLELSESYYNMIENNNRPPSKVVLNKLVSISELSEEYWLYGINTQDYINNKDDFKNLRKVLDTILELCVIKKADDLFNNINLADNSISKLLIKALKKDIDRFIEK